MSRSCLLRLRQPDLSRAGHHFVLRHQRDRARRRAAGGRPMTLAAGSRCSRVAAAPAAARLAARAHRRLCSGRLVDLGRHRSPRLSGRRLEPGIVRQICIPTYLSGLGVTLALVVISIVLGAILSLPIAYARMSRSTVLSALAYGYVYFFRGTPLLAQTFLIYYGLGSFRPQLEAIGLWCVLPRSLVLRDPRLLAEHRRLSGRDPARRDRERAAGASGKAPPRSACTSSRRCGKSSCRRR